MAITARHRNAALRFANRVRKEMGRRPVTKLQKGERSNGRRCPIARTIDQTGYVSVIDTSDGQVYVNIGPAGDVVKEARFKAKLANEFIGLFDQGEAPELELKT